MRLIPFTKSRNEETFYINPDKVVHVQRIVHNAQKPEDSFDVVEIQTVAVGQYSNSFRVKETIEIVVDRINTALQG